MVVKMSNKLTKEIAYKELQKIFVDKPFVLFGTGMSCAIDDRFGMKALEEELKNKLKDKCLSEPQKSEWDKVVKELNSKTDFETAMNNNIGEQLLKTIIEVTGDFIALLDYEYSLKIINEEKNWPAVALFKKLVDNLPGADRKLHVATPNYDMLAEYALERAQIPYINGFTGGVCRHLDWGQSAISVTCVENRPYGKKVRSVPMFKKHIRLYKLHGSLNRFLVGEKIIENNAWLYKPPKEHERFIITPGESKHEKLLEFRREFLKPFDDAVEKHNTFLFLGFGFNDSQFTKDIFKKLKEQDCNGLILTKDTDNRIETFIKEAKNLWLVCKPEGSDGTLIANKKYSEPLLLANEELWQVDNFVKKILGG